MGALRIGSALLPFRASRRGTPCGLASEASLRSYTEQFLHTVVAPGARTAAAQVAEMVEPLLPLGRCSVEQVSRHPGLRPAVLQHNLAREGESFSAVPPRLVERYMPNDRYSLTEVSQLLGFGAPSAFTRWFHERFGTSPSDWRRTARSVAGTAPPAGDDRRPPAPSPETHGTVRRG